MAPVDLPVGYKPFVEALKVRIREAQIRAALAVNRGLLALYWDLGRAIVERQDAEGWGTRVIERLAEDLQKAFPGLSGFSRSNVYRMRAFYLAYPGKVPPAPGTRRRPRRNSSHDLWDDSPTSCPQAWRTCRGATTRSCSRR